MSDRACKVVDTRSDPSRPWVRHTMRMLTEMEAKESCERLAEYALLIGRDPELCVRIRTLTRAEIADEYVADNSVAMNKYLRSLPLDVLEDIVKKYDEGMFT